MLKHQDLQITNISNLGRGSETQLQVGKELHFNVTLCYMCSI